jgi:hypothetical protein
MTYTHITKEQQEAWDKVPWENLIKVYGPVGYQYFCNKLTQRLCDGADPRTWAVMGRKDDQVAFLKKMQDLGGVTEVDGEPDLVCVDERIGNDGDAYPSSCESEDDAERVAEFMRNSVARGYWPVGGVIILGACDEDLKHVDRLLKVSRLMHGSTTFIQVPVIVVYNADWNDFTKDISKVAGITRTIEVTWGNDVVPQAVEFLVPEFVPLRQATAFSGEMDTRKSTLALDIAAKGSLFGKWFTGAENQHKPFITLFAGAEDDFASTIVPRFIAAGGNRDCLGLLPLEVKCEQQTTDGMKEYTTPLSFDEHLELLADTIRTINRTREWKVGLLINDPIISFFGNKNYNSPQDARDIMAGLKKLCEDQQLTIINICHFNKTQGLTAKQKTAGSKALIEAHRQAWAFDLMEDDKKITLIAPIKHNLLKDGRSYKITTDSKEIDLPEDRDGAYQKAEVGVIRFVGYSEMTADDRIDEKESKDRGSRKEIKIAILDVLKDGPKPAGHVCNELRDMGSISSLRRAAQSLEEEGKLRRFGSNNRNMTWELATEATQATFDDEVSNHGSL